MRTAVKPLIVNFMFPQVPKEVSESEFKTIYDPQTQITYFMGGGQPNGSRSYDGYKRTRERESGSSVHERNDAERWTDD